ncbi:MULTISPECIES: hypothetical protein [Streptomyces]|uniref:Secreted protein n=1 Tax=Streptomyces sviceus (strain ATCC 29083 / DSM 924 / JCM 4929 / NBRC 13980 / NCIMB 11184 / NRRL 5439 / UC 5370) TaxID=463191 RepID=B5I7P2_STRX2|nr:MULTISPECIES: hypothetical protein [Streptomyces]EDY61097.1 secreted protein [Streptomyces sviceus ATCC 29083]MYT05924.1 hypothetical protein [Streptomyces sp. SID5470]
MKSTPRTLAAVVTGVAAAMGSAAAPAVAVGTVPVPVPLEAAEKTLHMELPSLSGEIPLPKPGKPDGPQFVEGRLLPARTLPQLPITGGLPGAGMRAPVPHVLGTGFDHADVGVPASDLRTLSPGLSVDAPLTRPNPDHMGLPDTKLPEAGILAPVLQTAPGADLGTGPGL